MILPSFLQPPLVGLVLAASTGYLLGRVRVGHFRLGLSGALFTGLALGLGGASAPQGAFTWNLLLFVVCVGLLAAEDLRAVLRLYGMRCLALSVWVTGVGAALTYLLARSFGGGAHPLLIAGTYTGALTSSPGLGAALEATGNNPLVTVGYSVAYPFGVLAVVLFVQLAPALLGIDVAAEREALVRELRGRPDPSLPLPHPVAPFSLAGFLVCLLGGLLLGGVGVDLPGLGRLSLGTTGGTLLAALVAGAWGHLGSLSFRMAPEPLEAIRDLSLAFFLAAVGLQAGPQVMEAVRAHGVLLAAAGFGVALVSELAGFLLGRCVWRMNWVLLAGALCGAMTSTPGLGAAVEATGSRECAAGYGATYPLALVCMVLFTSWIHVLLVRLG